MPSSLLFVPAMLCLLGACLAIAALILVAFVRRSQRAEARQVGAKMPPFGMGWRLLAIFGFICMAAAAFGLWATGFRIGLSPTEVPEWSGEGTSDLAPLIRKHCTPFVLQGKSVGLVVAVVRREESVVMGFGRSSLAFGEPVTGDSLFEIGSITKTFTAILLASEIERGNLRMDQPIQELLPSNISLPAEAKAVTLKQLVTHSSGFPRLPGGTYEMFPEILRTFAVGSDPYRRLTVESCLDALQRVKLSFPPGTQSSYSNFAMTVLGYLLAQKTGCDYEALVEQVICEPLGMEETSVNLTPAESVRFASPYRALMKWGPIEIGLRSDPWTFARNVESAGGLRSSGRDMLKYLKANMQPPPQGLGAAIRLTHEELFHDGNRDALGMNWMLFKNKHNGFRLIWHNGGTGGFRSFMGFTPDGRYGVVVMGNSGEMVDDLALGLLKDMIRRDAVEHGVEKSKAATH